MKNIIIILLTLITISCSGQDDRITELQNEFDSILSLYKLEVSELLTANTKLQAQCDSFSLIIDSLMVNVEELEAFHASNSFVTFSDTAYVYIADTLGNTVEIQKFGSKINSIIEHSGKRVSTFTDDNYRSTYYMNDTSSIGSIIEDNSGIQTKTNYK
jgi:hypothetical protein